MSALLDFLARDDYRAAKILGKLFGMFISYRIYRKLGAPRWAALGFSDLAGRIELIREAR